jgi:hypothetical protein
MPKALSLSNLSMNFIGCLKMERLGTSKIDAGT